MNEETKKWILTGMVVILIMNGVGTGWDIFKSIGETHSVQIFESMIESTIQKSVEKEFKKNIDKIYNADYDYTISLLVESFADCRTEEDILNMINLYNEKSFKAQIAAMKIVAKNDFAVERLKVRLYKPEFVKLIINAYN